ncbi:MAG: U32 family peptidase [Eggerthellaceae bacterium]|nr:U32 family peptidase [Eggerthellaceae bacterium]
MNEVNVELLAPAGSMACLHAAVQAGADAVYLGVERFNARRGAENFSLEDLPAVCDWTHVRGAKVYLTTNTVILPSEVNAALELVRQAYRAGVDAFIVQDIGLATELHRTLPQANLHVSTQMNTHNVAGLQAAAALGAKRVTLARELSLQEVDYLCSAASDLGLDVETFAHGALCVCYSGQCFMSSLIGGRSANRGMCAQACRLPYELHNKAVRKVLDAPGEHLLSPKDLCTAQLLPELVSCGVSSLKIEGRMKSPEYVSAVVGVYRAVLDRALQHAQEPQVNAKARATEAEMRVLSEAFSRGFTIAYLTGDTSNNMMSYGRPNNRGVFVGRVADVGDGIVSIDCEQKLEVGDVLEFWTGRGHFAHTIQDFKMGKRGLVRMSVDKRVGKGDRVFRVRSAAAAYVDDASQPRVPVTGSVRLQLGQPMSITLQAPGGEEVHVEGSVVEPARTKAVTAQEVRDHIDRFGSTPFSLGTFDVVVDEGVGVGFSQVHKLRAQAAEQLQEAMLAPYRERKLPRVPDPEPFARVRTRGCMVAAMVTNAACARAARKAGADAIYVPAVNYKRGESLVAGQISETVAQAGYPNKCIIALPTVDKEPIVGTREERFGFDAWRYVKPDKPILVENLGQIARAVEAGALVEVGPHVPVLNPLALDAMAQAGVRRVWLSPELALGQIQELGDRGTVEMGLTIIGRTELMVTEHCLLMSQGPCSQNCESCPRRRSPHYLKDRKGYEMPVVTDCCGRSHLYNAVPLDIAHLVPDLLHVGVSSLMVDASMMNTTETAEAVARAVRARDLGLKSGNAVGRAQGTTTGHIFRGVS